MKNDLFSIGPLTVHGYGLMIGIGVVAAYLLTEYRAKKKGLDPEPVFALTFFSVLGGFLGSKLLFFMTILPDILKDFSAIKQLTSGWVVYGGIIGGILTAVIFCRFKKMKFLRYLDVAMPSVALAQALGRIGCFLAGCCYGVETQGWFAVTFTNSSYAPNGVPLVPIQLVASVLDFILFGALIYLSNKLRSPGQVGGFYLVFYSIGRFILEYFRGDLERGSVGTVSTSQFISVFTLLAGVIIIWMAPKLIKQTELLEEGATDEVRG